MTRIKNFKLAAVGRTRIPLQKRIKTDESLKVPPKMVASLNPLDDRGSKDYQDAKEEFFNRLDQARADQVACAVSGTFSSLSSVPVTTEEVVFYGLTG